MANQQRPETPINSNADQWQQDLNPNTVIDRKQSELYYWNASEIKELHTRLNDFTKDELQQIVVLKAGTQLEQGATYINLNDPARREFTAMGNMQADENNYFVPKSEISYQLWNRLIGVENPERLNESGTKNY